MQTFHLLPIVDVIWTEFNYLQIKMPFLMSKQSQNDKSVRRM